MSKKKGQTTLKGRDAETGRFLPVDEARRHSSTATVERVAKPGCGSQSSSPRGRDAKTGEFITVAEANRRPTTTLVEQVPNRGKTKD